MAYARQLPKSDCHIVEQYTRQFNYPEQSHVKTKADIPTLGIKTFFCSDVCAAYRVDLFEELGDLSLRLFLMRICFLQRNAIEHGYGVAYAKRSKGSTFAQLYDGAKSFTGILISQFHRNSIRRFSSR